MGLHGVLDVSSAENSRPVRVSQGFSVLREMNYKYSQPGHWKCFPLHSSSQETYRGGEAEAGQHVHLPRVRASASVRSADAGAAGSALG